MEHGLVCSVDRGGEELEIFKSNKQTHWWGPPCSSAKVHSGSAGPRMADPMACLLNTQSKAG